MNTGSVFWAPVSMAHAHRPCLQVYKVSFDKPWSRVYKTSFYGPWFTGSVYRAPVNTGCQHKPWTRVMCSEHPWTRDGPFIMQINWDGSCVMQVFIMGIGQCIIMQTRLDTMDGVRGWFLVAGETPRVWCSLMSKFFDHLLYTVNHKKTWHFIFDYNFG